MLSDVKILAQALVTPTSDPGNPIVFAKNLGFKPDITRPPGGWNGGTGIGYSVLRLVTGGDLPPATLPMPTVMLSGVRGSGISEATVRVPCSHIRARGGSPHFARHALSASCPSRSYASGIQRL